MKLRIFSALALAALAAAASAGTASADTGTTDSTAGSTADAQPLTIDPGGSICIDGNGSLCLYYSADDKGARAQTVGAISCYDGCGGSNYYFSDTAHGSAGLGDPVRNATHYAYNNDAHDGYAIFVSPNYAGAVDELCADGSWTCTYFIVPPAVGEDPYGANLGPTQNNNASQEYLSTLINSGA